MTFCHVSEELAAIARRQSSVSQTAQARPPQPPSCRSLERAGRRTEGEGQTTRSSRMVADTPTPRRAARPCTTARTCKMAASGGRTSPPLSSLPPHHAHSAEPRPPPTRTPMWRPRATANRAAFNPPCSPATGAARVRRETPSPSGTRATRGPRSRPWPPRPPRRRPTRGARWRRVPLAACATA